MAMQGFSSPAAARNSSRAAGGAKASKVSLPAAHKTSVTVKSTQVAGGGGAAPAGKGSAIPGFGAFGKGPAGSLAATAAKAAPNQSGTKAAPKGFAGTGFLAGKV